MIYFCQTTVFCKKALDKTTRLWYNLSCCRKAIWVWRSLVARYLGVVEAVGADPATQTKVLTESMVCSPLSVIFCLACSLVSVI